ncbi:lytic transglycosylase domain-containing protein [Dendrosporobacter sp. 1207_IL3150]|uniref:lytic transglycosylase domain-containing protein n=1 Tax=Dendrosporobacter sp. 1207_IL3150 TaxID=3084054 RepID=UPI002FDB7932
MSGINSVVQRINNIEQRFAKLTPKANGSFSEALNNAVQNAGINSNEAKQLISKSKPSEIIDLLRKSAKKHGVDPKLVNAIAENESGYNQNVVSSAGAVGVMQLMPDTASYLGVTNIHDASANIDGGVKYLKELLGTFNGDVVKAVAAYNAGPQTVIKYNGIPPYAETQNYVGKVMQQYRNSQ